MEELSEPPSSETHLHHLPNTIQTTPPPVYELALPVYTEVASTPELPCRYGLHVLRGLLVGHALHEINDMTDQQINSRMRGKSINRAMFTLLRNTSTGSVIDGMISLQIAVSCCAMVLIAYWLSIAQSLSASIMFILCMLMVMLMIGYSFIRTTIFLRRAFYFTYVALSAYTASSIFLRWMSNDDLCLLFMFHGVTLIGITITFHVVTRHVLYRVDAICSEYSLRLNS